MNSIAAALALTLLAAWPASAQAPQKVLADKSFIRFAVKQMNAPIEGRFRKFDASVAFDPAHPDATRGEFEVDVGSIDLGSDEGDTEAKGKTWLGVQSFPKAKFTTTAVKALGGNRYEARGNLTLKGITLPVVAPFTLSESGGVRTVEGEFPVKRLAYKVGEGPWADTETVADEVLVRFRFLLPASR